MLTSHTIKAQSRACVCGCVCECVSKRVSECLRVCVLWCEVRIIAFSGGFTEPRWCFLQTRSEGLFMLLRGGRRI